MARDVTISMGGCTDLLKPAQQAQAHTLISHAFVLYKLLLAAFVGHMLYDSRSYSISHLKCERMHHC